MKAIKLLMLFIFLGLLGACGKNNEDDRQLIQQPGYVNTPLFTPFVSNGNFVRPLRSVNGSFLTIYLYDSGVYTVEGQVYQNGTWHVNGNQINLIGFGVGATLQYNYNANQFQNYYGNYQQYNPNTYGNYYQNNYPYNQGINGQMGNCISLFVTAPGFQPVGGNYNVVFCPI